MCVDMAWGYNDLHDFFTYSAEVHARFRAKTWGNVFIQYVVDNSIMFEEEIKQVRSDQIQLPEMLSDSEAKNKGLIFAGATEKFIRKKGDPNDYQIFGVYNYREKPKVCVASKKYTWDLTSNSVTNGWKYTPTQGTQLTENQMLLLSALTKELGTKEIRQLCALYSLKDDEVEKTYVGYKFKHCASNFILQMDV